MDKKPHMLKIDFVIREHSISVTEVVKNLYGIDKMLYKQNPTSSATSFSCFGKE